MTLNAEMVLEICRFIIGLAVVGYMIYATHKIMHKDDRWNESFK